VLCSACHGVEYHQELFVLLSGVARNVVKHIRCCMNKSTFIVFAIIIYAMHLFIEMHVYLSLMFVFFLWNVHLT